MKASNKNREQTIASEVFRPALSEEYQERFRRLTLRLEDTLPMNRARIISDELRRVSEAARESDLDCQKYMAALSVLVDLSLQGWIFDFQDHQLTLKMENDSIDDKEKIRYRLSAERNAQFKSESVARFIKYMETERSYNGAPVSIRYLIGNKDALILAIKEGRQVCEPYIQMVTGDRDEHSGFKLSDIWRYFRYTWSIPYKTMPGRNIYYLVRDRLQPYHPIIGIFALGNSVLNLTVRDDDIGWTVEAIKKELSQRVHTEYCEQTVSGTDGKTVKVKIQAPIETDEEYLKRRQAYADRLFPLLVKNVNTAISEIYTGDLGYYKQTKYPHREQVDELYAIAAEYSERSINNRNNEIAPDWREEARSNLFKRKRASELAKLLETKIAFNNAVGQSNEDKLLSLLASEAGRKAIYTALIANRKCKIGSNMMDIIVCGSIPPYNQLLGGKLVSIRKAVKSYYDSFIGEDGSPRLALSRALQIALYTFEYKNNSPSAFCRVLGVRCGLIGPRGNRANIKRYLINSFTLETVTLSALSKDDLEDGIELKELSEKLVSAYNILIGSDAETEYSILETYNIAQSTPGDLRGDLSINSQAIANSLLFSL